MLLQSIPATPREIDLSVVASILEGNDLKLRAPRLQRDQEIHALRVQRRVDVPAFSRRRDAVKHAEGGVIEVTLGCHAPNGELQKEPYLPRKPNISSKRAPPSQFNGLTPAAARLLGRKCS